MSANALFLEKLRNLPELPDNLRFFAKKIKENRDVNNKFWRKLIVDNLERYADEIDIRCLNIKIPVKK